VQTIEEKEIKLVCEACGKEATFKTDEEAFMSGWDLSRIIGVTTCDTCPSAPLLFQRKWIPPRVLVPEAGTI